MENVDINWQDPVFGEVPSEHREWYLKESGTYWNNIRKDWFVRSLQKTNVDRKNNKGEIVQVTVLKAEDFQNQMLQMKEFIRNQIPNGIYTISNGNAFDLMRNGETKVEVEYQGEKAIQIIKLLPF